MIGARHASVQRLRRLSRQRRSRSEERAFVIDGPTLLAAALDQGVVLQEVFAEAGAGPDLVASCSTRSGATIHEVHEGVLARATDTVTPQAVAAIASIPEFPLDEAVAALGVDEGSGPTVLVLVGVNDPGNLGTLLRSAEASGARLVACCNGTVDPYNPKAVRASAGTLFGLPVVREAVAGDAVAALQTAGFRCVGTVVRGGTAYDRVDLAGPSAFVLGAEAHGLPAALEDRMDRSVTIPMVGSAESLNVGMAGTLLCFEALRQRRRRQQPRAGQEPAS